MASKPRSARRQAVIRVGADAAALPGRLLADRLKALRLDGGMTQAVVARRMRKSTMTISRWESEDDEQVPEPAHLFYLLSEIYKVDDAERRELMALADAAREPSAEVVSVAAADYDWLESRAARIETYQDMGIPGLLQTPDYARAMLSTWDPGAPRERVERLLQTRLARQRRLEGDRPLKLAAVVSESALRHAVGGPDAMREQLRYLIDRARLPNVELRVVPFSAGHHAGFDGPFVIVRHGESVAHRDFVWLTTRAGPVYVEHVEPFARAWKRIRSTALPHVKSVAMIAAMTREMQ